MNCPNCNALLKDGAKFCTKCGTRVAQQEQTPQAVSDIATKTGEGEEHAASVPVSTDMEVVKHRLFWKLAPGQVARVIRESELDKYDDVKGIIVAEGTTAYIRANGHTIACVSGGTYDFVKPKEGISGAVSNAGNSMRRSWRTILDLFKSKRQNAEATEQPKSDIEIETERQAREQREIFAKAKEGAAFSVVLLLDRAFPLVIGARQQNLDDYRNFVPMQIRTQHLDLQVGLHAFFQIRDKELFINHYLLDKTQLNTATLVHELADTVRVTIQDTLYAEEITTIRVPDHLKPILKQNLNAIAEELMFGMNVMRIVELTANSEDLERFHKISQELYLSEKELDYLNRTNDFKNRLETANLDQRATELELSRRLVELNKDELLTAEELRKFQVLLANEQIVSDARSEAEREAALQEIEKTELLRKDEVETIRQQCEENKYKRGAALAFMQLKDQIEFEKVRTQGQNDKIVEEVKLRLHINQLAIDQDYANRKREADLEFEQRQREADLDFQQRKREHDLEAEDEQKQFERMMAMQQAAEQSKENERRHQENMQSQQLSHQTEQTRLHTQMSAEQILASSGGEAATEYARSFAARNNVEAEREANRRVEEEQRRHSDMMFGLMNRMLDNQAAQVQQQNQQIQYQQNRADGAYNQSLNYTTRQQPQPEQPVQQPAQQPAQQIIVQTQPQAQPSAPAAPPQSVADKNVTPAPAFCANCGEPLTPDMTHCPMCGDPVA